MFTSLGYTHATVMSFIMAAVSAVLGGLMGGFRDRKAPLLSLVSVGVLR